MKTITLTPAQGNFDLGAFKRFALSNRMDLVGTDQYSFPKTSAPVDGITIKASSKAIEISCSSDRRVINDFRSVFEKMLNQFVCGSVSDGRNKMDGSDASGVAKKMMV